MKPIVFFLLISLLIANQFAFAQAKDSSGIRILGVDSIVHKKVPDSIAMKYDPRRATIRSAIIPGWGQATNKKYWKIPIVYAALGITAGVFNYNLQQYRKVRFAYFTLLNNDTANFRNVSPELQPFIAAGDNGLGALRNYRTEFRKNIDYSVLFFILFWGLNVVDATVDAHLRGFDVSKDVSLKIKPSISSNAAGISFVFNFK